MSFELTPEQQAIREAVTQSCEPFGEDYWLERDRGGEFPHDFYAAMAKAGWLGIAIPEAYGGSGLGVTEAALMMQSVAETGACMSGCASFHINIFGLMPIVVFGTEEQKRRFLPPIVQGQLKSCFGVTEPNTGLNTTQLKTRAVRQGRPLCGARPEGLDLHGPGGRQDPAAGAHHADRGMQEPQRWPLAVLHRPGPPQDRRAPDRQDGPQGDRLERTLHRRAGNSGGRPDRRGGQGLQVHPARHESGAGAAGCRGHRHRPRRTAQGGRLCERARRVRPPHREEPGHPASPWRRTGWSWRPRIS